MSPWIPEGGSKLWGAGRPPAPLARERQQDTLFISPSPRGLQEPSGHHLPSTPGAAVAQGALGPHPAQRLCGVVQV